MSYITEIVVSVNQDEEKQFLSEGYIQNPVNLNKESTGAKNFLWYKKGDDNGITRIQASFNDEMCKGLKDAGYQKVYKNLNQGAGGDEIYLWYLKGSTNHDIPIKDLFLSTEREDEAQLFRFGWEKLACNLNRRNGGCRIYLWVQRAEPTFVSDIITTVDFEDENSKFKDGYIRLDEDINRGSGGPSIFLWYRLTTDENHAITDLQICKGNKHPPGDYIAVDQNLNRGNAGTQMYLYYIKDHQSKAIQTISLIIKEIGKDPYEIAGVQVVDVDLNEGNEGVREYLCFYQ
ncbi:PREDICTED: uncharacterized protein LOC107096906 [Cyprinodon variegatus]|uniref:uncharacterized protein LOC107096906 n=1 Tax=Cyprinodon variegatus TaxID=28743 RepID=UPI000742B13B|nr:PREDICTED: uncharacterized protein LOC107096906 [Cyprinodon variegatus]